MLGRFKIPQLGFRGVVIIALGNSNYVSSAERLISSLRRYHSSLPIALFTDVPTPRCFDPKVTIIPFEKSDEVFLDRIRIMAGAPFSQNLYIDSDFLALNPVASLFDLLVRFDLALAHADIRRHSPLLGEVPDPFPEHRGGVMVWERNGRTDDFFEFWEEEMLSHIEAFPDCKLKRTGYHRSQGPLRSALWNSDVNFYVFPGEWACGGVAFVARERVRLMQNLGITDPREVNRVQGKTRIFFPKGWTK